MEELALFVLSFAFGVFVRSVYTFGWPMIVFVILLAAICAVARFLEPRRAYSLGALFFVLLACGMMRYAFADTPLPSAFAAELHHKVSYQGVVVSDPDVRDKDQLTQIRVFSGSEATTILAVASPKLALHVGDQVSLEGALLVPTAFATEGGRTFAYDKYLQKDGVRFEMFYPQVAVLRAAPWYSAPGLFARIKQAFLNGLDAVLPAPYAGLAAGIAIGGKSGLGPDLEQAFITAGLVQIVVLSGYNVMIVAEGIILLLGAARLPRKAAALAGALAVVLFVLIAGLSSTAIRAALMALIALYARATARSYAASRALLATVFLMLLWNPLLLAYDPGFSLSVAATAGLIWLAPLIERKLMKIKSSFWRSGIATTIAAQLAVWPLLLYDTGNLSLVSVPANVLTMPAVPLAMAASAIAGLAGMLLGHGAALLGYPALAATAYIIWVAREASGLPLASIIVPAFSFWLVIAAYAALAYIAFAKRSSMTDQFTLSKKASM